MPVIVENEMYQVQAHPLATGHAPPLNIQSPGHTSRHVQTTVVDDVHMILIHGDTVRAHAAGLL